MQLTTVNVKIMRNERALSFGITTGISTRDGTSPAALCSGIPAYEVEAGSLCGAERRKSGGKTTKVFFFLQEAD